MPALISLNFTINPMRNLSLTIVSVLMLSGSLHAQIAPAISIEHQYSNGIQQTSIGAGFETFKNDMVTVQAFKNGFAINAILQTTPLFLVEVQNMSVKRGFGRNSTIALLGGIRFHNLRIRTGAVLGQYDKKKDMDEGINFVVKVGGSLKFWKLD